MATALRNQTSRIASEVAPKVLPLKGEDLMAGFQYELDPAARRMIDERFGVKNVPTYVTCLLARRAPCRRTMITENLETGVKHESTLDEPEQLATFQAHLGNGRVLRFTLDLPKLAEARAAMVPADLVKDDVYERSDERPAARKGAKAPKQALDLAKWLDL